MRGKPFLSRAAWRAAFAAMVVLGLAAFLYGFHAIELGIGDKNLVALGPWVVARRAFYQAGVMVAALNLLLFAATLIPGRTMTRALPVLATALNLGLLVHGFHTVKAAMRLLHDTEARPELFFEPPPAPHRSAAEVRSLIAISDEADVEARRRALVAAVWGEAGLPVGRLPAKVTEDWPDPAKAELPNHARTDRLEIPLPFGFAAIADLFVPAEANGAAAIFHQGHGLSFREGDGIEAIRRLLETGYLTLAFTMPDARPNLSPEWLRTPRGELLPNGFGHAGYQFLERPGFSPLRLFLEPVVVGVNHLLAVHQPRHIDMIGLSGGGWTTTVIAAIDPRIRRSFPVAGTLPLYLQAYPPNRLGDWEEQDMTLLGAANMLEMYVLGGAGPGRGQVQVLNQFDGCCNRGVAALGYSAVVSDVVRSLGAGSWDLLLLPEHAHRIAPAAWDRIFAEMAKTP